MATTTSSGKSQHEESFGQKAQQMGDTAKQFGEKAKDAASNTLDKAKDTACNLMDKAKDTASGMVDKTRETASALGQKAEEATHAAGRRIGAFGGTVRENLPQSGVMGSAASTLADGLESTGSYLEKESLQGMAGDVVNLIRRNPVPALLVGIGLGFIIARATTPRQS